jgi:hypothetical protein
MLAAAQCCGGLSFGPCRAHSRQKFAQVNNLSTDASIQPIRVGRRRGHPETTVGGPTASTVLHRTCTNRVHDTSMIKPLHLVVAMLVSAVACTGGAYAQKFDPQVVVRTADVAAAREKGVAERLLVEIVDGSIEVTVDANADVPRIEAEFTVDGGDPKDVARRAELAKLYAERAADQTVVVKPILAGKAMPRDRVKLRVVMPSVGDASLRAASGDVTVEGTGGKLKIVTKKGDVRVKNHAGGVDVNGAGGLVELLGIGGAVKALATDGALTISLADGNDHPFDAQTRTGELRVEVGVDFDGVVKMHSTGGRLDVRDSAGRTRVPNAGDHSKTVEVGAASDQSELRSTTGAVRLTVRAK